MQVTAQIRLYPTPGQEKLLQSTMAEYISAVNDLVAYYLGQGRLVKMTSKDYIAKLPSALKSQALQDAKSVYKKCRKSHLLHTLKKPVSIWNNQNYKVKEQLISFPVWANQTQRIAVSAKIPKELMDTLSSSKLGTLRITKRNGKYIAQIAYERQEMPPASQSDVIGVDLGIKCPAVAVSSGGKVHFFGNGRQNKFVRRRFRAKRRMLQKKKKRKAIKKIGKKEHRWMQDQDHKISRQIVQFAIQQGAGVIKLENLKGIRRTARTSRKNNHSLHSWTFYRLAHYIEYKANLVGIQVVYVDPRYTSQTCPQCGQRNKAKDRVYRCNCGYQAHRDLVGAKNILAA